MTDVEILMDFYSTSQQESEHMLKSSGKEFAGTIIKAYRAGYEKGQQEGFQRANSQDYYIGLED